MLTKNTILQLGDDGGSVDRQKSKRPGSREIASSSGWLTLPLTILTVALIAFVFRHQVRPEVAASSTLNQGYTIVPDDGAIYVQVDSTMLVFLASWMSSVAPLLTCFAITLATFPVTKGLLSDTEVSGQAEDLPTSFQFHLMLKLINGATWTGLWGLLNYRLNWRRRADGQGTALTFLISVSIGSIFLSVVIFAADTWLHLATTTVNLTVPRSLTTQNALYSLSSLPACTNCNNSFAALVATNTSCTLNSSYSQQPIYDDPESTLLTLSGRWPSIEVLHVSNSNMSYLGTPTPARDPNHDFQASTFGARTACSITSRACNLTVDGNVTFSCNGGNFCAEGDQLFRQGGLAIQVFKYSDLSDFEDWQQEYGVPNPFYIAGATYNSLPSNSVLSADPDLVTTGNIVSAVFQCQVTMVELEYTSVRGDIRVISEKASNESITNMFMSGVAGTAFGQNVMKVNMNLAAMAASDARDFANRFGVELNNILLSSGAGSVRHEPVELAQTREGIMAARIPKAPFYLLIASSLTFVLLGICLTVVAIFTPSEARQAQHQLTIAGLVANVFDRGSARNQVDAVEQLFVEYYEPASAVKISIDRTSKGGFELTPLHFAQ